MQQLVFDFEGNPYRITNEKMTELNEQLIKEVSFDDFVKRKARLLAYRELTFFINHLVGNNATTIV